MKPKLSIRRRRKLGFDLRQSSEARSNLGTVRAAFGEPYIEQPMTGFRLGQPAVERSERLMQARGEPDESFVRARFDQGAA